jgi:trk system potassium uptake protein TrkH
MVDIRPVGYVIGWLLAAFGASMLIPLAVDLLSGSPHWQVFGAAALLTFLAGGLMVFACEDRQARGLTIQQSFLLATSVWVVYPFFGSLPFMMGAPGVGPTDAVFEAMSALTTTGATVLVQLETLPPGTLVWRGMMQWFGGIGIVIVAMVFLPTLKVGGMQLFRSEAFDTLGKILPRAGAIAMQITWIYLALSFLCFLVYSWCGMVPFDAWVHTMTTVSTGGMANYDASFAIFGASAHYAAVVFMILAALPFVRYIQLMAGTAQPLWRDTQIRTFLLVITVVVGVLSAWMAFRRGPGPFEPMFREVLFNIVSNMTGTGYASADYMQWGSFAVAVFFVIGLIGGCSGSTACSVKIFRYQLLLSAVVAQVNRIHSPNRVVTPRYEGRPVPDEVMNSVMAFFMLFFLSLGIFAFLLMLLGVQPITAISGAATALANIGPGLGPEIGPAGNFKDLSDAAKWVLTAAMLLGRLELMTVLVIFTPVFWRA